MYAAPSLESLLSELGNDHNAVGKTFRSVLEATRESLSYRTVEHLEMRLRVAAGQIFLARQEGEGESLRKDETLFAALERQQLMEAIAFEDQGEAIVNMLKEVMKNQEQVQRDMMTKTG